MQRPVDRTTVSLIERHASRSISVAISALMRAHAGRVALVALAGFLLVPSATSAIVGAISSTIDSTTEATLLSESAIPARGAERGPRPPRIMPVTAALAAAATLATPSVRWPSPTIRPRRRIGDVGDDWRALLLGAPPVRA